jgi:hypothetical protein
LRTSEPLELKSKVLAEAGPAAVASASATATTATIRRKRMVRVIERPPVGWIARCDPVGRERSAAM